MKTSYKSYRIIEKIGAGGMATLFLAEDSRLHRRVALKVLHPSFGADAEYIARFEREAREAAALNHRNIVTIHDFGSEDEAYFIVMEYVEGMDLRAALQEVDCLPLEVSLAILEEAAGGLQALHERHLVHRDVKPANILLGSEGEVKITDFGLTKRADAGATLGLTAPGSVIGTAYYMSPEQAVGGEIDVRSDIFSLGVTAYEMFSGARPFQGKTYSEVVDRVIAGTPEPMVMRSPLVSPAIEALVQRMMAKEASRRHPGMREVIDDIERCWEELPNPVRTARQRRDYLKRFIADPRGFSEALRRENVQRCLERGTYYMSLGLDRFDDALKEIRAALRMDPGNERARLALAELEKAREVDLRHRRPRVNETTVVLPAAAGAVPVKDPASTPAEWSPRTEAAPEPAFSGASPARTSPPTAARQGRPVWWLPAGGGLVVALAAGVLLIRGAATPAREPRRAPTTARDTPVGTSSARPSPSGPGARTPVTPPAAAPAAAPAAVSPAREMPPSPTGVTPAPAPTPTPAAPSGRLDVACVPADAALLLRPTVPGAPGGGRFRAPLTAHMLGVGRWNLRASARGYAPRDTMIAVAADETRSLRLVLAAEAPPPTSAAPAPHRSDPGYTVFKISVFPPCTLLLDGSPYQREPAKVFFVRAAPGASHVIEVRTADERSHRWEGLTAAAGDTLSVPHFSFSH